jgi:hypothetical protein
MQHGGKNPILVIKTVIFFTMEIIEIISKQFHLLFMHDDNKSNSGQIGQVVAMGGSGKTQKFFL